MFDRGVVHTVVVDFIVDNYCLRFNRGVVHIVAGYNVDITVLCLTEECFILLWLLILWTITVLNGQQYNQLQQYEPLLCQT
jgi:hypothetical protein